MTHRTTMSFLMGRIYYKRNELFNAADHPWKEVAEQEKKGRIVPLPKNPEVAAPHPPEEPKAPIEHLSPQIQEAIQDIKPPKRKAGRPKR